MAVDTLLDNRFSIEDADSDPIGEGGMAVIYAGTDRHTDLPVAAKTLLPQYQGSSERRARFRREAQVLKSVQQENIVELIDVVDGRRGTWILMEQLHGKTLRQKLEAEGPFNPKTVTSWLTPVCAALEHMHQLGYVHLDITPQNIFLTDDGEIKLIDFGIAQKAYVVPTREGEKLLGTAAYISPEHGSGRVVTPLSDVYSLGCVVFELLTGKKTFSERGALANEATVSVRQSHVPKLPTSVASELNLPAWVDPVVGTALHPNAEERYPSITAFAEAFDAHANPPFIRFSWPKRQKQVSESPLVPANATRPIERQMRTGRDIGRTGRWARREMRNARRTILVFTFLVSLIFATPLVIGPTAMDWFLGIVPGSTTTVIDGDLNLRSAPGTGSEIRVLLSDGQKVRVTGIPIDVEGTLWWPLSVSVDGTRTHGWAYNDGLARSWLMNRAADTVSTRAMISDWWKPARSFLPG